VDGTTVQFAPTDDAIGEALDRALTGWDEAHDIVRLRRSLLQVLAELDDHEL
jgi:hypothetical protein